MSLEKKRQFVNVTYDIMQAEGIEAIKIRRLAQEMNCTSTVIYRYFDNLDHLIALASIRCLNSYLIDFSSMINDPLILTDPYSLNIKMWQCLARHAYANMEIYEQLFFGSYSDQLGEVIFEYYQLFLDDERMKFDGFSSSILFNEDLVQRDIVLLRRAAALGSIHTEDVEILGQVEVFIFHGLLLKYMPRKDEEGIAEVVLEEFTSLLKNLESKYRIDKKKNA